MGKIRLDITEDSFGRPLAGTKELSILIGVDSLSYMVTDERHEVLWLREYALSHTDPGRHRADVEAVCEADADLKASFARIRIGVANRPAAAIPNRLYAEPDRRAYLAPLCRLTDDDVAMHDDVPGQDLRLVYPSGAALRQLLQRHFPAHRYRHLHTCMLSSLAGHLAAQPAFHLFACVSGARVTLMAFDRQALLLANTYVYQSAKDFLYYVLLAYEQLGLDKAHTPLFLAGQLMRDSEIFRLLYRYVEQVDFFTPQPVIRFGPKLAKYPPHFHFDLHSLLLADVG